VLVVDTEMDLVVIEENSLEVKFFGDPLMVVDKVAADVLVASVVESVIMLKLDVDTCKAVADEIKFRDVL
jgi:hypothetical protein